MQRKRLLSLAVLTACALGATAEAATLQEADSAYQNNRVAEAETLYAAVADDAAQSSADRASARAELARIDWLIRGETDAAATAVAAAGAADLCATLAVTTRVFLEASRPDVAIADAQRPRGACPAALHERFVTDLARAHIAQAAREPAQRQAHLSAAQQILAGLPPLAMRSPRVAGANLSLAIAQGDAPRALQAWRDYFWLDDADAPTGLQTYAGRVRAVFAAGLRPRARERDRAVLTDMLIRAGFANDAAFVAGAMSEAAVWRRARAYFTFRNTLTAALLRANRAMAAQQNADDLDDAIVASWDALMRDAGLSGDRAQAFLEAYNLFGTDPGTTGGYPSLHFGHVVQDDRMHVEQYGRRGDVRFVVVDNMLANGFQSWLWDGGAQVGGWSANGNLIVQVRPAYTTRPLNTLQIARPGAARDQFIAAIEQRAPAERALLVRDGVAELPAMSDRLRLQAVDQIVTRIGAEDAALIAELWRATNQFSIEAHEGRHALDDLEQPGRPGEELEYRAKLSQLVFTDYPRLSLTTIVGAPLDETQHGIANRRILEDFRAWMQAHAAEIEGYDRNTPPLAQLHLLSDAQISAVARSRDPWAR